MANGLAIAGGSNYWSASGASLSPDSAQGYSNVLLASAGLFLWNSDLTLARLAAASMRQGAAPSATPVAQTFTLGEASRPGTDANVGGADGTLRSGLGTGTGTASSLIFQTPTLAGAGSGAQSYATRLTIATAAVTSTVPILLPDGTAGAPALSWANFPSYGLFFGAGGPGFSAGGTTGCAFIATAGQGFVINTTFGLSWANGDPTTTTRDTLLTRAAAGSLTLSGTTPLLGFAATVNTAADLAIARLGAASLRVGLDPSATPVAQTFTLGEASRNGTDSNVGGGDGTLRSGLGTGTGTASSLIFQTPTLTGSGTVAQTYGTRMTVATAAVTLTIPLLFSADNTHDIGAAGATRARDLYLGRDIYIGGADAAGSLRFSTTQQNGAAAASGTLTNAPAAGNPTKWIPVDDAGTTRYIPAW